MVCDGSAYIVCKQSYAQLSQSITHVLKGPKVKRKYDLVWNVLLLTDKLLGDVSEKPSCEYRITDEYYLLSSTRQLLRGPGPNRTHIRIITVNNMRLKKTPSNAMIAPCCDGGSVKLDTSPGGGAAAGVSGVIEISMAKDQNLEKW